MKNCPECAMGRCMAHGGAVDAHGKGDLVDRIMTKRMSKGGAVANDTDDASVDMEPNEFDVLVKSGGLDGHYVGEENLGNERLDEDERDLVARIMRSRAKKDRNPRPA